MITINHFPMKSSALAGSAVLPVLRRMPSHRDNPNPYRVAHLLHLRHMQSQPSGLSIAPDMHSVCD